MRDFLNLCLKTLLKGTFSDYFSLEKTIKRVLNELKLLN